MAAEEGSEGRKKPSGFLENLAELMSKLEEVAETGRSLSKTGTFEIGPKGRGAEGGPGKGVFGLSVNVGLGGKEVRVEPFGNIRRDAQTGESTVEETREPLVDVFDEDDRLLVVAELPGVEAEDVRVDLDGRSLVLSARRGEHRYRKAIEVPAGLRREAIKVTCRNGIAEIACAKKAERQ